METTKYMIIFALNVNSYLVTPTKNFPNALLAIQRPRARGAKSIAMKRE